MGLQDRYWETAQDFWQWLDSGLLGKTQIYGTERTTNDNNYYV